MTGYTSYWDCYFCGEGYESISTPDPRVCEACLRPLARLLCKEVLGADFEARGVDRDFWEREATRYAEALFRHSKRLRRERVAARA